MTPNSSRTILATLIASVSSVLFSEHAIAQEKQPVQTKGIEVLDVRLGFETIAKDGRWLPLAIELMSHGEDFRGSLEITTPDPDGVPVSQTLNQISLAKDTRETIHHYIRLANFDPNILFTLRDETGRTAFEHRTENGRNIQVDIVSPNVAFVVGIGNPAGLSDVEKDPNDASIQRVDQRVVNVKNISDLPTQWFAYAAVDTVVLSTEQQTTLDAIDPVRAAALQTWVRQGGKLVVTVASNWQVVSQSFLQSMLPATPEGIQTAGRLGAEVRLIEGLAGGKIPMQVTEKGIPLVRLADVRGSILPRGVPDAANNPFLVEGTYGFGTVTLIGFDPSTPSFRDWVERRGFWLNLLGLTASNPEPDSNNYYSESLDIAAWIDAGLSSFTEVTVVPFSTVALLILLYIALIGPVDYFVLKKIFGRLELTWITFPLIVVGVSVASYFSAYWMKGDQVRVNRVEMLDIDTTTETLRGQQFFSIFSPLIARYTVTTEPGFGVSGTWADLGMGRAPLDRWTAANGSLVSFSQMSGTGGLLGAGGYAYAGPEPITIVDAPIRIWSVKSFIGQWLAKSASNLVEANLKRGDLLVDQTGLVGTVTNRLGVEVKNAWLLSNEYAFDLGTLKPGDTATLELAKQRPINSLLNEHNAVNNDQTRSTKETQWAGDFDFLLNLTVATRDKAGMTSMKNQNLSNWSLKPLLDAGKVVLIGQIAEPASKLWINAPPVSGQEPPPIPGVESRITLLRVVMEPSAK